MWLAGRQQAWARVLCRWRCWEQGSCRHISMCTRIRMWHRVPKDLSRSTSSFTDKTWPVNRDKLREGGYCDLHAERWVIFLSRGKDMYRMRLLLNMDCGIFFCFYDKNNTGPISDRNEAVPALDSTVSQANNDMYLLLDIKYDTQSSIKSALLFLCIVQCISLQWSVSQQPPATAPAVTYN